MLKPQQKIFLMWSTTVITSLVLIVSALGLYKNYDQLNNWASAGFLMLGIVAFLLKYNRAGFVGVAFCLLYSPEISINLPRHIWVIIDIVSIYIIILFTHWSTNPHKKGLRFEKHVSSLFPKLDFVLQDQSKDVSKFFDRNVESDGNPDLILRSSKTGKVFAVECKWRARWWQDQNGNPGIWWNKTQWDRYAEYGKKNNMPVYIALGIGGSPEKPHEVYFLEADKIQSLFLKQSVIRSGYKIQDLKEKL